MTQTGSRWAGTKTEDVDRQRWQTPKHLFDWLESRHGKFTIDCAASDKNALCSRYFTEEMNALNQFVNVNDNCFLNPPFNNIPPFLEWLLWQKDNMQASFTVVLPSDLSTAWGKLITQTAFELIHVTGGRISYHHHSSGKKKNGNNKPTIIARFTPGESRIETLYVSRKEIQSFEVKART